MRFLITDEERQALAGLPLAARVAYLEALRPWMDYATGRVGEARRISWQMIAEVLYVEPAQGLRGAGTPNHSQVRRAVAWLERAGLVRRCSRGTRLVFALPLAAMDSSGPEKPDRNPTGTRQGEPDRDSGKGGAAVAVPSVGKADTEPDRNPAWGDGGKADTPPESGIRGTTPLHSAGGRADEHPDSEVPESPMAWAQVFMDRFGYSRDRAMHGKALQMFRGWVDQGVPVGPVADAVIAAEARAVVTPVPTYFEQPVAELLAQKTPGAPGQGEGSGGNNHGGNHGARRQGSQGGSSWERMQAAAREDARNGRIRD